ncbi:unnamed protein product [Candidula unifasciata]|uniref:Transmembrane protein 245 n=1 Tax=Candidula unifasciata TaxID=100452 RepID=A0A8S3ZRK9_9EUPU|nr:unnamed protein product [Candidula unifasciata]
MSTPSLEYLNTVWQYLPQGHEKALKQAFYNTAANIFVVIAAAVAVTVYFILAPFIRPLYWALLCGTFLYPFKRSLTNLLRQWLKGLDKSGTPFAVGLAILPLQIGNSLAESISTIIWSNIKIVLGLFLGIPSIYWVYYFTPLRKAIPFLGMLLSWLYEFLEYFSTSWVWTFFAAYLIGVAVLWKPLPTSQKWLRYLSAPVWVSLLLHFANAAGPLRVPLFILMISVMIIGAVVQMKPEDSPDGSKSDVAETGEASSKAASEASLSGKSVSSKTGVPEDEDESAEKTRPVSSTVLDKGPVVRAPHSGAPQSILKFADAPVVTKPSNLSLTFSQFSQGSKRHKDSLISINQKSTTKTSRVDQCFMTLFWGHVIVRLWMHVWLILLLLMLPVLHFAIKKVFKQFDEGGLFHSTATNAKNAMLQWLRAREDVLMPHCLRGLGSLLLKGDQKIIMILEQGLDQATSILFILMMLVGTVLFSVIGAVQIQRETMFMVTSAQNLLNKTMNSEFSQFLPYADMMRKTMDQVLEKTHEHGRNFIASKVKDFLPVDQSSKQTEIIINQTLEMWDKLYETMLLREQATNTSAVAKPGLQELTSIGSLWQTISSGKGIFQITWIVDFVKENLDMFMSVWESIWMVLKSNMNLFFTVITTILSALLGGGTAILNFVISAIIFLTTLFYLLASSGDMYKPAELFSNMSPGSTGSRFGTAVEFAISNVFKASLKMASFYGLYTWLIHLIFGLDIVFLPSALAACFAAVPFLGPYWAALPAVFELWLVQDDGLSALLLFLAHMAPAYIVDTAIYREIEGSHPYVTGLAIAGGMLFMGLEGALIGPIILCCLHVVLNMYSSMLQNEPATPTPGP